MARDVILNSPRVKSAETRHNRWSATIPEDHTLEDLMNPRYWSAAALMFRRGDIIEVRTDDEAYFGEFIVLDCSRIHAALKELRWVDLSDTEKVSIDSETYEYKWKGPHLRHCVLRKSDGEVVLQEQATKQACVDWIAGRKKAA